MNHLQYDSPSNSRASSPKKVKKEDKPSDIKTPIKAKNGRREQISVMKPRLEPLEKNMSLSDLSYRQYMNIKDTNIPNYKDYFTVKNASNDYQLDQDSRKISSLIDNLDENIVISNHIVERPAIDPDDTNESDTGMLKVK